MKKVVIGCGVTFLAGIIFLSMIVVMLVSIIGNYDDKTEKIKDAVTAELLEKFVISGTYNENHYNLNFTFEGFGVKDIDFATSGTNKGSVSMIVKVPKITGSREDMAFQLMLRRGFTKQAACGVLGNMLHECGNFKTNREEGDAAYGGEDIMWQGYGLFQWTNTESNGNVSWRRRNVISYLKSMGLDPTVDSDEAFIAQVDYAISEKPSVLEEIKRSNDAKDAAEYWCRKWEIPSDMETAVGLRRASATDYFQEYADKSQFSENKQTESAELKFDYEIVDGQFRFTGKMADVDIAGAFEPSSSRCDGVGWYGEGATADGGNIENPFGDQSFSITGLACVYEEGHAEAMHYGWDLCVNGYAPVYAVTSGTVVHTGAFGGYGNHVVIIKSGNLYVIYAHMVEMKVSSGDTVRQGQRVGTQGGEGEGGVNMYALHLHLEFRTDMYNKKSATANWDAIRTMFRNYAINYKDIDFSEVIASEF